jgi:hypothetical protein
VRLLGVALIHDQPQPAIHAQRHSCPGDGLWKAKEILGSPSGQAGRARSLSLDVLDANFVGPARQELIELRLGGPNNFVLQYLYQPVD